MRTYFLITMLLLSAVLCIVGCSKEEIIEPISIQHYKATEDEKMCNYQDWCSGVDTLDSYSMLNLFVERALELGLDLNYIYSHPIKFTELPEDSSWAGYSFGMFDDKIIHIGINTPYRESQPPLDRLYLMIHELGHDILNLTHMDDCSSDDGLQIMNQIGCGESIDNIYELKAALDAMIKLHINKTKLD